MNKISTFQLQLAGAAMAFVCIVSAMTWFVVSSGQKQLIEFEAARVAEIITHQSLIARSIYSKMAVKKLHSDGTGAHSESGDLPGFIPLPAQFLRALAEEGQKIEGPLYSFKPVSQWNLAEEQGIRDEFQQWAWNELTLQDQHRPAGPIDWKPVSRVDTVNGSPVLRYMTADPAASVTCVNCHNSLELNPEIKQRRIESGVEPGHQWNLHELLGAFEVSIPLEGPVAMALQRTRSGSLTVLAITIIGMAGVGLIIYIDSLRQQETRIRLEKQANQDFLTGLPNRLHFESELQERFGGDSVQEWIDSIMLLDLNNFKDVNDTLGHAAGDFVLVETAKRLREVLRESDFVARLGGDEFAILLPDSDIQTAQVIAEKISDAVGEPLLLNELTLRVGVSIGIAVTSLSNTPPQELLRCADVAMYKAKRDRSVYAVYDKNYDNNDVSSLAMVADLKKAIDQNSLKLHFQPKYSLDSNKMIGVEAMLRWTHRVHGVVRPDHLVYIAEQAGMMSQVTNWVMHEALRVCKGWREAGYDLKVAVNLSAADLQDDKLIKQVSAALDSSQLPASALILEVTESQVLENLEQAERVLRRLDQLGVKTSLDDYGTGRSSLAYLSLLPISELKLDGSFLVNLFENEKNRVIVDATVKLAHNLKIPIVTEGVEDGKTLAFLRACGCDRVQGYYLSCPMPKAMFLRRLPDIYNLRDGKSDHKVA